jgi:hypothetical protein
LDRDDNIYRKPLHEQALTNLAEMCANVARNTSADSKQSDTAHALRVEWLRLGLDHLLDGGKTEVEMSLKKRMTDFLAGVPSWMLTGF